VQGVPQSYIIANPTLIHRANLFRVSGRRSLEKINPRLLYVVFVVYLISDDGIQLRVLGRESARIAPNYYRELANAVFYELEQCDRILQIFIYVPNLDAGW